LLRPHELAQLKALPLFSEMKEESLGSLLDAALLQQFPTGVILIHEGDHADFLHVLVEGLVEIFTEQNGGEWGISLINPVSTFILAAVVSDQPYLNSARTLADSRVLLIPAQHVRAIFDQDVAWARIVARELALAYRSSIKKLKGYMARSSVERLANWILTEARKEGVSAEGNIQGNIVVPFDRGTLASHIGTTRENLSRSLALLTEHGVRIRGREIVIDKREKLEAFARPQRLIDDPMS
jgi:CRP/FNR family transcriptional activator FtrB